MKAKNNSVTKWGILILLPIAVILGVLVAMPITVSAADQTVTIIQTDTVAQVSDKIITAINNTGGSGTVTVNGSKNNANASLSLSIPSGVTVIWNANYAGDVGGSYLITFEGNGTFEMASGSIQSNGYSYAVYSYGITLKVSGGTISSEYDVAIYSDDSTINISGGMISSGMISIGNPTIYLVDSTLTVSNGTISSENGNAIVSINSTVNISGGMVISVNGYYAIYSEDSTLTINGGTIMASGEDGVAIRLEDSTLTISGGTISTTCPYGTIFAYDYKINISGGFVFAYGTTITSTNTYGGAIYLNGSSTPAPTIGGNAVICVWNQAAGTTTYSEGTSTDLVTNTGASVTWAKSGSQDGISYANATNSGFFPISGIVVNAYMAPTTYTDDAKQNNMIWLWGGLGVLAVLAIGGGSAFIVTKNRKKVL